ncbi:MAG: spore cortex biosynthesis protein YabQ [Clostridium sp.]|nr:spore cortex biosynthesis protein YabQ [Clostridium sp.]
MPLPINIQLSIIVYSFLSGLLTGGMFDLYRIIRGSKVPKPIIVIEDILFSVLAAMIVFTFLLYTDYAFLGTYVYIFMILAVFIYMKFISPTFISIERSIFNFIGKAMRILLKDIGYVTKLIFSFITGKR